MRVVRASALGFIQLCQPTLAAKPPAGEQWLHEIKHDGYRMMARRAGDAVKLYTRTGGDWTKRFPAIVAAVAALKARSVHIDGEAVVCDERGMASFDLLRSWQHDKTAFLFAFDLLEHDGEDLRTRPLIERKERLAQLLDQAKPGLRYTEHLTEFDGAAVFAHACQLGCEGIVSKRRDSRYTSGRSHAWLKTKNAESPAARREATEDWSRKRRRA